MSDESDQQWLNDLARLVAEAEAADRIASTIVTRVRLAHAKSMYIRASALIRKMASDADPAQQETASAWWRLR